MGEDCYNACNRRRGAGCDFCGTGFCNSRKDCEPAPAGQEYENQWMPYDAAVRPNKLWSQQRGPEYRPNYSVLDRLEKEGGALRSPIDGKFHFKLVYPLSTSGSSANYNWWKQGLNPFDYPQGFSRTTGSATFDKPFPLYEEIELTLPYYRNRFRGIERSNKNWVLLDGIFGNTYMYGIGMRYGWGSGFPGDRTREYQVELWLWPDDVGGGSGLSAGAARDTTPKSLISSTLTFNIDIDSLPTSVSAPAETNPDPDDDDDDEMVEESMPVPEGMTATEIFGDELKFVIAERVANVAFDNIEVTSIRGGSVIVDYTITVDKGYAAAVVNSLGEIAADPSSLTILGVVAATMSAPVSSDAPVVAAGTDDTATVADSSSDTLIIFIVVVLAVVIVALGAALIWTHNHHSKNDQNEGKADESSSDDESDEDVEKLKLHAAHAQTKAELTQLKVDHAQLKADHVQQKAEKAPVLPDRPEDQGTDAPKAVLG